MSRLLYDTIENTLRRVIGISYSLRGKTPEDIGSITNKYLSVIPFTKTPIEKYQNEIIKKYKKVINYKRKIETQALSMFGKGNEEGQKAKQWVYKKLDRKYGWSIHKIIEKAFGTNYTSEGYGMIEKMSKERKLNFQTKRYLNELMIIHQEIDKFLGKDKGNYRIFSPRGLGHIALVHLSGLGGIYPGEIAKDTRRARDNHISKI